MIRAGLIWVKTENSLGIVNEIRIPLKINDNISYQHLLTLRISMIDMAFWNSYINKNNHRYQYYWYTTYSLIAKHLDNNFKKSTTSFLELQPKKSVFYVQLREYKAFKIYR